MSDEAVSADQVPIAAEQQPEAGSKTLVATACLWVMLIANGTLLPISVPSTLSYIQFVGSKALQFSTN